MLHRRHYTLDQANALLPAVERVLAKLRAARLGLAIGGPDTDLAVLAESTGGAWPGRERAAAALALTLGFEELEDREVIVRDVDRGLVDFPTFIEGHEAYLCWRAGEAGITHWHGLESGFAGRRPLGRAARR
jgi:hypothetical protein